MANNSIRKSVKKVRKRQLVGFFYIACVALLLLFGLAAGWRVFTARAAPTTSIVYSADGGNSWSSAPTVKSGQELLVRLYFNNDSPNNITDAQISTTLPAGFTRTPGSTRLCLNPGTANPLNPSSEMVCNDGAGQGGAVNEGAVWSGNTLSAAPNAGIYGVASNATSGLMAAGKKRYLNLHQCLRNAGFQYITVAINDPPATDWFAGTNANNNADTAYNCGANTGGWVLHGTISAVQNLDLLGRRYINMHQCMHYYSDANGTRYITTLTANPAATNWGTGTNTANTANGAVSCAAPGSGWIFYPGISSVQPLDTLNNRYVNIHECLRVYTSGYYLSAFTENATGWRTGTKAGNSPDTALDCPAVAGWPVHSTLSDFQVIDMLDTNRGQGFAEYKTITPNVAAPQTFNQTAALTGTGTGNPVGNGSVTVEPDLLLVYSADGGASWTTDPRVEAGANLKVRLFTHNKRFLAAAASRFTTALPSGFNLVPGSTRVCLSPGTLDPTNPLTEIICNNTAGQSGAINEGAVWSGGNLNISPTAGLFGQPVNATSGYLAAGKNKYLNLHQCVRTSNSPGWDWITIAIDDPIAGDWYAGTNSSNTADSSYDCGEISWPTYNLASDVQNLNLTGKRYINMHQCAHYFADATNGNRWITGLTKDPAGANWATGTNTDNSADGAVNCAAPGGGWTTYPSFINTQPLDTLANRYVNIHECVRFQSAPTVYVSLFIANPPVNGWRTGTKASNTPDVALDCPAVAGWSGHTTLSDYQVIDTLDINRGQVFAEFDMTAPNPPMQTDYTQAASLTNTGTGDQSAQDSITVLVDPGVIITETGGSTNVAEGGASDTIYAQLTAPPQQDVTVTFTDDNGQLAPIPPVIFTPSNWSTQQPVTITAVNDFMIEGPHTDSLNYTTSSSDASFNGLSAQDVVTVNITDNDAPGANIIVTDDITSEDGDTGQFCITLLTQPSADVTIALSSSDINEATVPPNVTILAANWNQQSSNCVTVTGADDGPVGDPIKTVIITTGNVTSADPNYDALDGSTIDNVTVYNQNNDPPGFRVTVIDGVTTEDGGTATVEIRLLSQPDGGADVTIPLSIDDSTEGTLNGVTGITITNANWDNGAANQVTITGVNDDFTDGNIAYHLITGDPSSGDPVYNALTADDIVNPLLTNLDTDTAGVTVTQTGGSTNVTEGGATDSVSIVLNTRPMPGNSVVVTVQPQPQLNVGSGPGASRELTFDTNNWNIPQAITVGADDDGQLEGAHAALLRYSINTGTTTEQSYIGLTGIPDTNVDITDNDTAEASITTLDDAAENPANDGHFRVHLSKQNSTGSPITISYTVSGTAAAGSDYIPLSGNVAVPSGSSSADITVDVTGMEDDLLEGTQTVIATLTGSSSPQVSIDGGGNQAVVGILDDEIQTASASLAVLQNGSESGPVNAVYQVTLTNQNETGAPITFSINPAGGSAVAGTDYANFSGQTIGVPNNAADGTFAVTVIDDNLAEGPQTVRAIISNPSLTGLAISNTSAVAGIEDNDTASVTITATKSPATENSSDGGQFTVNLSAPNDGLDPLTVSYSASGSASAGTDYAPLPGQVEIPIGADSATIDISTESYDDPDFEGPESVIVTLSGTSNSSFVLGTPLAAVVVIADSDTPPSEPEPPQPQPQPGPEPAPPATAQPPAAFNPPRVLPEPVALQNQPQPSAIPENPNLDTDHDQIPDENEDQALNNGDGNADGEPDKYQSNVASKISEVTNTPVTLAVAGDCQRIHGLKVIASANTKDRDYAYPHGLFDFELACTQNGQSAEATLYLDTANTTGWTWRKFNRFEQSYATIGEQAKISTAKVGNSTAATAAYHITDGGSLDEDRAANGIILDPAGPGVQVEKPWPQWWWLVAIVPAALLIWMGSKKHRGSSA